MPEITNQFDELQLLTKRRAAELLDCSVPYINTLMNRGDLDYTHIGPRGVRITLDSLKRFLSAK